MCESSGIEYEKESSEQNSSDWDKFVSMIGQRHLIGNKLMYHSANGKIINITPLGNVYITQKNDLKRRAFSDAKTFDEIYRVLKEKNLLPETVEPKEKSFEEKLNSLFEEANEDISNHLLLEMTVNEAGIHLTENNGSSILNAVETLLDYIRDPSKSKNSYWIKTNACLNFYINGKIIKTPLVVATGRNLNNPKEPSTSGLRHMIIHIPELSKEIYPDYTRGGITTLVPYEIFKIACDRLQKKLATNIFFPYTTDKINNDDNRFQQMVNNFRNSFVFKNFVKQNGLDEKKVPVIPINLRKQSAAIITRVNGLEITFVIGLPKASNEIAYLLTLKDTTR